MLTSAWAEANKASAWSVTVGAPGLRSAPAALSGESAKTRAGAKAWTRLAAVELLRDGRAVQHVARALDNARFARDRRGAAALRRAGRVRPRRRSQAPPHCSNRCRIRRTVRA